MNRAELVALSDHAVPCGSGAYDCVRGGRALEVAEAILIACDGVEPGDAEILAAALEEQAAINAAEAQP